MALTSTCWLCYILRIVAKLRKYIKCFTLFNRILDDYLAAYDGIKTHLIRRSQPSKLMYIGELLNGRTFSPKMVSFFILF